MIHPRYDDAFASITPPELACIHQAMRLDPVHVPDGPTLLRHCRERRISHAELIMSLAQDRCQSAVSAVERLIMRPIDRRTPAEVNISRLPQPPGSYIAAAPRSTERSSLSDQETIVHLVATTNPKRPGTDSHTRFAAYRDGMTIAEAITAGVRRSDLKWDHEHGHIRLETRS